MTAGAPEQQASGGHNQDALDELRKQAKGLADRIEALAAEQPQEVVETATTEDARVVPLPPQEPSAPSTAPRPATLPPTATAEEGAGPVDPEKRRGVRLDDLPKPVPKRSRLKRFVLVLVVLALVAGAFAAGIWLSETEGTSFFVGQAATEVLPEDEAQPVVNAPVDASDDTSEPSENAAGDETDPTTADAATDAVDSADAPEAEALVPSEVLTQANAALVDAGYNGLTVELAGSTLVIEGVLPAAAAEDGYFAYVDAVASTVADLDGIEQVTPRLFLRGDDATLRGSLAEIVAENPIEFDLGSTELTDQTRQTLQEVADTILAHPGLRIRAAGHTDASGSAASNNELAALRAEAVVDELVRLGIPITRLDAVAYGELFPDAASAADNRRVVFEVAP